MSIVELRKIFSEITGTPEKVKLKTYLIIERDETVEMKLADVENECLSQDHLRNLILENIRLQFLEQDELELLDLSSHNDGKNILYKYDLDIVPEKLMYINQLKRSLQASQIFNFEEYALNDIKAFIFEIKTENQTMTIYRKNYSINVYSCDKFMFVENEGKFENLEKDVLRVDGKIDFFYLNKELYIYDLSILEKYFGFEQIIIKSAGESIEDIKEIGILENPEVLSERLDEISFSRKLANVTKKSPLKKIHKKDIVSFTQSYPELSNSFRYSDNNKIQLDTKKSQNMFLKLLNDDYLHSQLTNTYYTSKSKDRVYDAIQLDKEDIYE